jgi:glucose dehydrogenase
VFGTEILFFKVSETVGLVTWGLFGIGLLVAYSLRFRNKKEKEVIEFLKLFAIGLVACYPINFYSWTLHQNHLDILIALGHLIVPVSGTIYIYDRWILKPEKMKKKFVVTLTIQLLIIFVALTYAFVQQGIANEMQNEAIRQEKIATEQAIQANELRVKLENCR